VELGGGEYPFVSFSPSLGRVYVNLVFHRDRIYSVV